MDMNENKPQPAQPDSAGMEQPAAMTPMAEPETLIEVDVRPIAVPAGPRMAPRVAGAALTLTEQGKDKNKLTAQLDANGLRSLAAHLLTIADLCSDGRTATVLVVTNKNAWIPGQVMQTRLSPKGFHNEFLLASKLAVPEKPKLIKPDGKPLSS